MNLVDKYALEKQYIESLITYGCKDNLDFDLITGNQECLINTFEDHISCSVEKTCKKCMKEILDKNGLKKVLLSLMETIKYSSEYEELGKVLGYCSNCHNEEWLCCTEKHINQMRHDLLLITGEKLC